MYSEFKKANVPKKNHSLYAKLEDYSDTCYSDSDSDSGYSDTGLSKMQHLNEAFNTNTIYLDRNQI